MKVQMSQKSRKLGHPAPRSSSRGRPRCRAEPPEVTLLDYGAGNVRSVRNALKKLGCVVKEVRAFLCFFSAPFNRTQSEQPPFIQQPSTINTYQSPSAV